jgi:hypothetical protein
MKVGDKIVHKLSLETMTIKKISESVAVCRRDEPIRDKWMGMETEHWTAVCAIENLEVIEVKEAQLNIF